MGDSTISAPSHLSKEQPVMMKSKQSDTSTTGTGVWTPPDGGYGWLIVVAGFLLWFEFGHIAQSGIFMLRIAPEFNATNTQFSGLNSVQGSAGLLLGMLLGPLIGHFGCRPLVLIGTLLVSSGYISSSFVSHFPVMYLTYGLLPSLGIGIFYCSTVVAVNQYFVKKSSKANALALSGFNVSTFAWPPLGTWLCDWLGWRKAFLIEGAIHGGIGLICVILLRPPGPQNTFCLKQENVTNAEEIKPSCKERLSMVIDFSPLRDYALDIFFIGKWLQLVGHFGNAWYIPVRSELIGFAPQTAAFHASLLGVVVAVMTLAFSPVGDLKSVSKGLMFTIGQYLTAALTLASVAMSESLHFYVYAAVLGILQGIYLAVDIAFYVEVCGGERLAAATGWFAVVTGLAPLTLHAVVGSLLDRTGNVNAPFFLAGISQLLCGVICTWVIWHQRVVTSTSYDVHQIDEVKPRSHNIHLSNMETTPNATDKMSDLGDS